MLPTNQVIRNSALLALPSDAATRRMMVVIWSIV